MSRQRKLVPVSFAQALSVSPEAPARKPVSPSRAGDCLSHPLILLMLAVWLLNDHVLKDMFGNAFTGKASDVEGVIVFDLISLVFF